MFLLSVKISQPINAIFMNSFVEPLLAILAIAVPLGVAYLMLTRQSGNSIQTRRKTPESANKDKRVARKLI